MLVAIGSPAAAERLARLLEKDSIRASVIHTPPSVSRGGCSYSVRVGERYKETVKKLAADAGIPIKGFYREDGGREEYDLS